MKTGFWTSTTLKRLGGCLAVGFALALLIGPQEGTKDDYGYAFRQAVFDPRIFVFLGIGLLIFVFLTFWPQITPYLKKPGVRPIAIGLLTVIVSMTLMHWYDPLGDGKFSTVATAAGQTAGLSPLAQAFFGWGSWALILLALVLSAVAVVLQNRILAWVVAAIGVLGAVLAWTSHAAIVAFAGGIDHSLGAGVAVIGYLTVSAGAAAQALSNRESADTKLFVNKWVGWRPGMPLAIVGLVVGILGFGPATWFSPNTRNATIADTRELFRGTELAPLSVQYLAWLGILLLVLNVLLAGAACYLKNRAMGWAAAALGAVSLILTLITMYNISALGGSLNVDGATGPWQNLGTGGWMACAAFFLLAGAGVIAATAKPATAMPAVPGVPQALSSDAVGGRMLGSPGGIKTLIFVAFAAALFYPPTATTFWQSVLVSQIGVFVLLAVGLNVVVGWAGLLDLGYIAFYAIGSYVTAYLVGSLPIKPPDWLLMSPLLAIPFAIGACLIAGVALGAPTLRLRGDYLAIVTLGFGEIIRIIAINAEGVTNSTRGPSPQVPHPVIDVGFIRFEWGLNQLQYWYLLLVIIVIVVLLFHRLEGSRLGRAWAAVREDEVAAQASGVNTTRVKLMAFAIGASTSGLAGVFFASQVGYFNPDNFILSYSILIVAYVVFGGMGSLPGAMAGAAVLTWLPEFLRDQVPAEDRQLWIGAVLVVMMIFRPQGLIPARRRAAELKGLDTSPRTETRAVAADEGLGAAER